MGSDTYDFIQTTSTYTASCGLSIFNQNNYSSNIKKTEGSTNLYRSVSEQEANSIKNTGNFSTSPYGMDCKQFTFPYEETASFGVKFNQNIIVKTSVPTSTLNNYCNVSVDSTIFKSGTITVYENQLDAFNSSLSFIEYLNNMYRG